MNWLDIAWWFIAITPALWWRLGWNAGRHYEQERNFWKDAPTPRRGEGEDG